MKINLFNLVLASAITFLGCSEQLLDSKYYFKGNLGNEEVHFWRNPGRWPFSYGDTNYLMVKKEDGKIVTYADYWNNLILDQVTTLDSNGVMTEISDRVIKESDLELAQKQFDDYLARILEQKKNSINKIR